jgi:glycerol-3-phosphate acyltransferase PlsY
MAWMEQLQAANGREAACMALVAYVLGCFATGYYLVRALKGQDIREVDSGSVGARNVGRLLGKKGFFLTVLGDFGKGVLAVWAARHFTGSDLLAGIAMLAVVAGHIWPAQLRFHGGKGVATSLGALLVLDYQLTIVYAALFVAGFALTRRTVMPGLIAYAGLPLVGYWIRQDGLITAIVCLLGLMILFAHRRNIVEEIPALAARRRVAAKPERPKL